MAVTKKKTAKGKRKKRKVYFEPTYLREMLGLKDDVTFELQRTASFNKPMSEADPFVDQRVSYQPDPTASEAPTQKKTSSRQYKRFWASLTKAQKEALRLVYLKNPEKLSKAEVARQLGVRVETLQERIDYAIKKLAKFFPQYSDAELDD